MDGGNCRTPAPQAMRDTPEIILECEKLGREIHELEEQMAGMEQLMIPIMREEPCGPCTDDCEQVERSVNTPLGCTIRGFSTRITFLQQRMQEIVRKTEV